jgi:hypothetical protein
MRNYYLDVIEDILINGNIEIENYNDPEKGMCQFEAICDSWRNLVKLHKRGNKC